MGEQTCRHCDRPRDEHHEFDPKMPDGCVCDPGTWQPHVPGPACEAHQGDPLEYCERCEHEHACHEMVK